MLLRLTILTLGILMLLPNLVAENGYSTATRWQLLDGKPFQSEMVVPGKSMEVVLK